jgi:hypothetical protein
VNELNLMDRHALYRYIGPDAIRARATQEPPGRVITGREELADWLHGHPEAFREGATFVIDDQGALRLAPRRTEHVACAGGGPVRAAGELRFELRQGSAAVVEASNQSTGYAPGPHSWRALAAALDALGIEHPRGYTTAFEFRRCPRCDQLNVIKEGWFYCGACNARLPLESNL